MVESRPWQPLRNREGRHLQPTRLLRYIVMAYVVMALFSHLQPTRLLRYIVMAYVVMALFSHLQPARLLQQAITT